MPCNVRVLAAECCKYRAILRQILRSLEILTANDQHMVHRFFHTEVLSQRHVFTQAFTYSHAFTQGWFYTQIPSCAGVFTQGCFYTKKTFAHRRVCTSTRRCLYTALLLQRSAFTRTCVYTGFLLTQVSFCTQKILLPGIKYLTQRCSSHRKTFVQRRLFRHIYFYKKDFCMDTFTERGFYTQVLLDYIGRI